MTRTKRNLLLVMVALLLAGVGTWAAFRFLVGEAPPAQPEYLPRAGAAAVPTPPGPAGPVRQGDGSLRFDFAAETVGAEPKSIVPAVGQWLTGVDGERRVLVVDGRGWARGQTSAGLADKARALYGERYAEFLDNVQAYAYFPLAVAQDIEDFRGGEIELAFKCVAGRIDQAAGIVFNLKPNGDYLVLRANCLEDNLVLFRYEQGKRSSVEWVGNTPTPTGSWHTLKVAFAERRVTGSLDGKASLTHDLVSPVSGRVGVWSKADSVVYIDDLSVRARRPEREATATTLIVRAADRRQPALAKETAGRFFFREGLLSAGAHAAVPAQRPVADECADALGLRLPFRI